MWYSDVKELMLPDDIVGRGLLLLASHLLRDSVMFSAISLEVQKHFNPDKICLAWTTDEDLIQLLSSNIMSMYTQSGARYRSQCLQYFADDLIDVIKESQTHLYNEVQSVEGHSRFP